MRLTVLSEDTKCDDRLICEHGLALYIEIENRKLLFDTGASAAFYFNANKLGINLKAVDTVIISHGHDDHGGGLSKFLEINSTATVYLSKLAFENKQDRQGNFIGINSAICCNKQIKFLDGNVDIGDGLEILSIANANFPIPVNKYFVKENSNVIQDGFKDELYLLVPLRQSKILVCGCAHRGIDNILNAFENKQIQAVIGGLHTKDLLKNNNDYFRKIETLISKSNIKFYLGHCTGDEEIAYLETVFGQKIAKISCGQVLDME